MRYMGQGCNSTDTRQANESWNLGWNSPGGEECGLKMGVRKPGLCETVTALQPAGTTSLRSSCLLLGGVW